MLAIFWNESILALILVETILCRIEFSTSLLTMSMRIHHQCHRFIISFLLCSLACSLFDAPVSIVSLVYDDNLWFKSVKGPFGRCTEREGSICSYVMVPDHAQVLIIEDLSNDARFSGNPYVAGPPFIRFYAGCPLVASDTGHRYGTLCVLDFKPRAHLPPALYNVLCNLAELTVRELEREMHAKNSACGCGCEALATRSPKAFNEAVFLIDASETQWPILYANSAWCNLFGVELAEVLDDSFWSHFQQSPGADLAMLRARLAQGNGPVSMNVFLQEDGALT
jgi:PAS domain-containing protein